MYRYIRSVLIICLIALPLSVSAQATQNINDLIARTQALLSQINTLQGGSASGTTIIGTPAISGVCPSLSRVLKRGSVGVDVSSLQQFLAQDRSVYPEGLVTGYFGALTQSAVQRWQTKFGVVSSGSPATTGFGVVGPRTMAAIRATCSPAINTSSGPTPAIVGGVIQTTPATGVVPLTVNITATVNIARSCVATEYALDFGDGSGIQKIAVPAGHCTPMSQSFTHTYRTAGSFTIKLSSGTHQSTASIIVSGPAPTDALTATVGSSTSPLTATFTGTIISTDAGSCASDCTDQLNFGDGTSITIPIPATGAQSFTVTHTYASAGTYTATLTTTAESGTMQTVAKTTVTVTGTPPVTTYSITSVLTGVDGKQSMVNVQISYPPCSAYALDWGDGSPLQRVEANRTRCKDQSSAVLTHTYSYNGTITIRLTDGDGVQKATATLTIANAGTVSTYGITSVTLNVGGNARTVSAQLIVPSCPTFSLDWGDSTTPTVQSAATGCTGSGIQTPLFTHTYGQNGSYVIVLKNASSTIQSVASFVL
jgi:PKD repeat protein